MIVLIFANFISYLLLKLGGLEYESKKQLIIFALLVNVIDIPIEVVLVILTEMRRGGILAKSNVFLYLIGGLCTMLIIIGTDYFMESIYIPPCTAVVFSMGISLLEMILIQKKVV